MTPTPLKISDPGSIGLSEQGLVSLSNVLNAEIERARLPGAVVLISRGGRIGHFEAYGRQDPAHDGPMRRNSIFRIYSMTKPIVSVAVMMLVEQGRLLLGDPLAKYIPEFAKPKVGVERDGKLELEPAEREIAVHDLLRHTSGLTYDFVATGALQSLYTDATLHRRQQTNAEFCRALAELPLLHHPGTHWSYSHSTDVLGRLVEIITGRTLAEVLSERILRPLGMDDTGFCVPPDTADRIAQPFANDPETGNPVNLFDVRQAPVLQSGGGGLVSTAADYTRFLQMLAGGGTREGVRILGRKTLEFMTSNHLGHGVVIDPALGLLPPGHGFGLGFAVRTETGLASFPGTAGTYYWGGIAGTTFWVDSKEELFALLLIQAPGQREYYRMLFRNLVYAALE